MALDGTVWSGLSGFFGAGDKADYESKALQGEMQYREAIDQKIQQRTNLWKEKGTVDAQIAEYTQNMLLKDQEIYQEHVDSLIGEIKNKVGQFNTIDQAIARYPDLLVNYQDQAMSYAQSGMRNKKAMEEINQLIANNKGHLLTPKSRQSVIDYEADLSNDIIFDMYPAYFDGIEEIEAAYPLGYEVPVDELLGHRDNLERARMMYQHEFSLSDDDALDLSYNDLKEYTRTKIGAKGLKGLRATSGSSSGGQGGSIPKTYMQFSDVMNNTNIHMNNETFGGKNSVGKITGANSIWDLFNGTQSDNKEDLFDAAMYLDIQNKPFIADKEMYVDGVQVFSTTPNTQLAIAEGTLGIDFTAGNTFSTTTSQGDDIYYASGKKAGQVIPAGTNLSELSATGVYIVAKNPNIFNTVGKKEYGNAHLLVKGQNEKDINYLNNDWYPNKAIQYNEEDLARVNEIKEELDALNWKAWTAPFTGIATGSSDKPKADIEEQRFQLQEELKELQTGHMTEFTPTWVVLLTDGAGNNYYHEIDPSTPAARRGIETALEHKNIAPTVEANSRAFLEMNNQNRKQHFNQQINAYANEGNDIAVEKLNFQNNWLLGKGNTNILGIVNDVQWDSILGESQVPSDKWKFLSAHIMHEAGGSEEKLNTILQGVNSLRSNETTYPWWEVLNYGSPDEIFTFLANRHIANNPKASQEEGINYAKEIFSIASMDNIPNKQ